MFCDNEGQEVFWGECLGDGFILGLSSKELLCGFIIGDI